MTTTTTIGIIAIVLIFLFLISKNRKSLKEDQRSPAREFSEAQIEAKRQAEEYWDDSLRWKINSGKYTGPLPERRQDGSWTSIYPIYTKMKIAGMSHSKGLKKYTGPCSCLLEAEPGNKVDPNAIKVVHRDGHHLGYIPRDCTEDVRRIVGPGLDGVFRGRVYQGVDPYDGHPYYWGEIIIE